MSQYILDTDHLTLFQHNHPLVIQKVQSNIQNIRITIITAEEQLRGRFNIIRRNSQSNKTEELIIAYRNLRQTIEFFSILKLLDFTRDAHNIYSELRRQNIRIGTQDLKIASIALANNSVIVTRNYRDFSQITDLKLEDWTISTD
jgi:tRNA(fMet)-specific endonuclease VapC